jgi:hypothetical protein
VAVAGGELVDRRVVAEGAARGALAGRNEYIAGEIAWSALLAMLAARVSCDTDGVGISPSNAPLLACMRRRKSGEFE